MARKKNQHQKSCMHVWGVWACMCGPLYVGMCVGWGVYVCRCGVGVRGGCVVGCMLGVGVCGCVGVFM